MLNSSLTKRSVRPTSGGATQQPPDDVLLPLFPREARRDINWMDGS